MFLMKRALMTTLVLNCRMQMSSVLCLKFLSLLPLRAEGLPLLMICLLKPGTQSLVVNFPAYWLLIVTVDARLSGWNGTGKSIALCWLITDFPADQNALIDDCSCGGSLSRASAPGSDSRFFLSRTGPGYPHNEQEGWASPQIWLSNVRACRLCTAPLSRPLDGAADPYFNTSLGLGKDGWKRSTGGMLWNV